MRFLMRCPRDLYFSGRQWLTLVADRPITTTTFPLYPSTFDPVILLIFFQKWEELVKKLTTGCVLALSCSHIFPFLDLGFIGMLLPATVYHDRLEPEVGREWV